MCFAFWPRTFRGATFMFSSRSGPYYFWLPYHRSLHTAYDFGINAWLCTKDINSFSYFFKRTKLRKLCTYGRALILPYCWADLFEWGPLGATTCLAFFRVPPTWVFVMKWFDDSAELRISLWRRFWRPSEAIGLACVCWRITTFSERAISLLSVF